MMSSGKMHWRTMGSPRNWKNRASCSGCEFRGGSIEWVNRCTCRKNTSWDSSWEVLQDKETGRQWTRLGEERKKEFKESIATVIEYAKIINGKNIHVMAGLCEKHDDLSLKETFIENIKWACDQFQKNNLTLLIEPINQRNKFRRSFRCLSKDA